MSGRKVTEELVKLFAKYKVTRVFAGHIHGYAKTERDGVVYSISGGGGGQLHLPPEFGGFYHYLRIDVDKKKITDTIRRVYD
jgi:hypothetical protein